MLNKYFRLQSYVSKIKRTFSKSYQLQKHIQEGVSKILPHVNCIDVGASYYPHPAWEVFRMSANTNWVAIEPNSQNLSYLKTWSWPAKVKVVKTGLSELGGQQTLYVTNVDSGSSLLKPVINSGMAHRILSQDYFFPLKEVSIETLTLQSVIESQADTQNPITIKLDTQGSEFSILLGVSKTILENLVVCIELENTLLAQPIMKNSTPFYEVYGFFEKAGFELVYLKPIEILAPVVNKDLSTAYVLNECDATFLLRNDLIKKRPVNFQLAMLGCYVSYSLYGEAMDLLKHLIFQKECNEEVLAQCKSLLKLIEK